MSYPLSLKSKTLVVKILITKANNHFNFTEEPRFLHTNYFMYKSLFWKQTFPLLGDSISDMQLVYMDTNWEELSLRVEKSVAVRGIQVKNNKTLNNHIVNLRLRHLLVGQIMTNRPHGFLVKTLVRRSPREINKYYGFINTRLPYSSRNYMYRLIKHVWTKQNKLLSMKNPLHALDEVRFARRTRSRSLLQKPFTGQTNATQVLHFKFLNKPLLTLNPLKTNRLVVTIKNSYKPYFKKIKLKLRRPFKLRRLRKWRIKKWQRKYEILSIRKHTRKNQKYPRLRTKPRRILRSYNTKALRVVRRPVNLSFRKRSKNFRNVTKLKVVKPVLFATSKNTLFSRSLKLTSINPSKLVIKTCKLNSFILRNIGVFTLSKLMLQNSFPRKLKSQIKKKLFSFVYPGQSKKNVLIKRKKQVLARILSKSTQLVKSLDRFSYRLFHQLFLSTQSNKLVSSVHNLVGTTQDVSNLTYRANLPLTQYRLPFAVKGENTGDLFIHQEVRIPRIRFKPGYQRIWRQVREALKSALNVKFQYQKQLTKYLVRFYHLSNQYLLSYSESTLDKIILYSHLLPDLAAVTVFQNQGFIYLNGNSVLSTASIVIKNDVVQLVVSLWYYMVNKWLTNWTQLRLKKFKRLVYRKNKPLQYKVMKNKKQLSYYTPNWIYQTRYDNTDIKPYLEVDFFTLSSVVLTETYLQYYHKPDDLPDLRNSTYLLYNWKYIT